MLADSQELDPKATARYFTFRSPAGWPLKPVLPGPAEYEQFLGELATLVRRRPWLAEYPNLASAIEAAGQHLVGAAETDGGVHARATARQILKLSPGADVIVHHEWVFFWPSTYPLSSDLTG